MLSRRATVHTAPTTIAHITMDHTTTTIIIITCDVTWLRTLRHMKATVTQTRTAQGAQFTAQRGHRLAAARALPPAAASERRHVRVRALPPAAASVRRHVRTRAVHRHREGRVPRALAAVHPAQEGALVSGWRNTSVTSRWAVRMMSTPPPETRMSLSVSYSQHNNICIIPQKY